MSIYKLMSLFYALSLLCACATQPLPQSTLVASLSVGVQDHSNISRQIAQTLFPHGDGGVVPHMLEFKPVAELTHDLNYGNYDVAVGLIEQFGKNIAADLERIALKEVTFSYFILPENTTARYFAEQNDFFSHMKSIGYVSIGNVGELNQSLIVNHPNAYRFQPCGTIMSCVDLLQKKHIDAFSMAAFSSKPFLERALENKGIDITRSWFVERQTFGVMLNSQSLSDEETQQLIHLFSQTALNVSLLNLESRDAVVNRVPSKFDSEIGK